MTTAKPAKGERIAGRVFEGVVWDDADLTDTWFEDCTITDGAFVGTTLRAARFIKCRQARCRFPHADLRETTFEDCAFADPTTQQGVNFAFGRLDESRFERCDLTHAPFEGADLHAARFEDCNLLGAGFRRATFHRTFGRSVVRTAVWSLGCNMDLVDLAGARLAACDLSDSRLREADLSGADLEGASLCGADLFQAVLDDARLAGADLRRAEVSGLDLRRLAGYQNLQITAGQQFRLLTPWAWTSIPTEADPRSEYV